MELDLNLRVRIYELEKHLKEQVSPSVVGYLLSGGIPLGVNRKAKIFSWYSLQDTSCQCPTAQDCEMGYACSRKEKKRLRQWAIITGASAWKHWQPGNACSTT